MIKKYEKIMKLLFFIANSVNLLELVALTVIHTQKYVKKKKK